MPTDADAFALALRQAVRAERSRQGLTQAELADRVGWSRQKMSNTESGLRVIAAADLPTLCGGLGVGLGKLLQDAPAGEVAKLRI